MAFDPWLQPSIGDGVVGCRPLIFFRHKWYTCLAVLITFPTLRSFRGSQSSSHQLRAEGGPIAPVRREGRSQGYYTLRILLRGGLGSLGCLAVKGLNNPSWSADLAVRSCGPSKNCATFAYPFPSVHWNGGNPYYSATSYLGLRLHHTSTVSYWYWSKVNTNDHPQKSPRPSCRSAHKL